jgi:hypothetical protein
MDVGVRGGANVEALRQKTEGHGFIPRKVTGIFNEFNPSGRTMVWSWGRLSLSQKLVLKVNFCE